MSLKQLAQLEYIHKMAKGRKPWNKGMPMTVEAREILRKSNLGRKQSKEHVLKRMQTKKKNYNPLRHNMYKHGIWLKLDKGGKEYQKYMYKSNSVKKRLNQLHLSKKRASGELTKKIIQQVYEDNIKKYGTLTCYLCLKFIQFGQDALEHKMPISRGGTNEYSNLGVSHNFCNSKKYNKTVEEYMEEIK